MGLMFLSRCKLYCPFVPINPAILSRINEIHHILSALEGIRALVATDQSIMKLLSENAPAEVQKTSIKLGLNGVAMIGWTAFNDAFHCQDPVNPLQLSKT